MTNEQIRATIVAAGLKQWQAAEKLGMTESSFSRFLRHELTEDQSQRVLEAIELAKTKRED